MFDRLRRLFGTRSGLAAPEPWLREAWTTQSAAGVPVTRDSALKVSAVYRAVSLISQTLAQVPLVVYRRLPNGGKRRDYDNALYPILSERPCPEMDSFTFRETLQTHILLTGNAYCEIQRDDRGRVRALWPLSPAAMTVERDRSTRRIVYRYQVPDGGQVQWLADPVRPPILHLKGLSTDGLIGRSVLTAARDSLGLALAQQDYASRYFANDARPGGIIESPIALTEEAQGRLKSSWDAAHRGLTHSHRIAVLEHGLSYKQTSLSAQDSQLLEQRKFSVQEIARLFGVPPHLLGDLDRATFSNIEQQSIEFLTYSMLPWFRRWEAALKRALMPLSNLHVPRFVIDGLLRGDQASRAQALAIGRQWGWLSQNDCRQLMDLNPIDAPTADEYLTPMNMITNSGMEQQDLAELSADRAELEREARLMLGDIKTEH